MKEACKQAYGVIGLTGYGPSLEIMSIHSLSTGRAAAACFCCSNSEPRRVYEQIEMGSKTCMKVKVIDKHIPWRREWWGGQREGRRKISLCACHAMSAQFKAISAVVRTEHV